MGREPFFLGFERSDGSIGVRNYTVILPTVVCAIDTVRRIAHVLGDKVKPLYHHEGCTVTPPDIELEERVLTNLCLNPNVAGVLLVSLGCESVDSEKICSRVADAGKPVELISIQELGGVKKAAEKGVELARKLVELAGNVRRVKADIEDLVVGVKCGASDATSGIAANPACGVAVDHIIDCGGTAVFGETTEVIGAEHILAKRCVSRDVAEKLLQKVREMEERARSVGVDIRGGQPTMGNIRGGLTTIEEKSLGAIVKSGSRPIMDVLEYGEKPRGKGLYFMDSPGREPEFLTGVAAAGAQIILFTTGRGAPQGFPICPVIKICGNPETCSRLRDHIDVDVSGVFKGESTIEEEGEKVFNEVIEVASGKPTRAEKLGLLDDIEIYIKGPVI